MKITQTNPKILKKMLEVRKKKLEVLNENYISKGIGFYSAKQEWSYFTRINEIHNEIDQIKAILNGETPEYKIKTYEEAL